MVKRKVRTKSPRRVYKRPLKLGIQRLIDAIYQHHEGITKSAEKITTSTQNLNLWRRAGAVPLKHVGYVAHQLNVPQLALNYIGVIQLNRIKPDWTKVVVNCKLSAFLETYVLAGEAPPSAEDILSITPEVDA